MEERERRIGMNEALFREVNERLQELAGGSAHTPEKLDLICECGNASCASRIEMDPQGVPKGPLRLDHVRHRHRTRDLGRRGDCGATGRI